MVLMRKQTSRLVLFTICFMYLIFYVDRVNLSTAAPVMQKDLGLTATQLGIAFSAFAYLYDDGELAEWISPVRRLEEEVHEVHVLFSNCHRDQAVTNARRPSGRSTRRIRRLG